MKVVVLIDSFKGSISSISAGNSVMDGVKRVFPNAEVLVLPLADGGEGTVDALVEGCGGEFVSVETCGPLNEKVLSTYGIINNRTAIMEMSTSAGITLIDEKDRNPLFTTTFGVGEMIKHAIDNGCRDFIIGIGGSATNDGGIGMLSALGYKFLDQNKNPVPFGANGLKHLKSIDCSGADKRLKECSFMIACDVNNPLCGENGCSAVYGPQKGATPEMVRDMDYWMNSYAEICKSTLKVDNKNMAGAGAAGGLGFAFATFLKATLKSGISLVLDFIGAEEVIKNADVVVTGEGRLDGQSAMGKAPVGVARLAKKHLKKVIAFSGVLGDGVNNLNQNGIDAYFPIINKVVSLEQAMDENNAKNNLTNTVEQVFRVIKEFGDIK